MTVCKIRNCHNPARGDKLKLCGMHYKRLIRHGHPLATAANPMTKEAGPAGTGKLKCAICGKPYKQHKITEPHGSGCVGCDHRGHRMSDQLAEAFKRQANGRMSL